LSARISTLHVKIDDKAFEKVKSSGLCVTTGTGSTSWYIAINSMKPQIVKDILSMANCESTLSAEEIKELCYDYNTRLEYSAGLYFILATITCKLYDGCLI
jgi:NAD+ kinase